MNRVMHDERQGSVTALDWLGLDKYDGAAGYLAMHYEEFEPAQRLRTHVRCFWLLRGAAKQLGEADPAASPANQALEPDPVVPAEPDPVVPDGCPELIFNFADVFRARTVEGVFVDQPKVMLVGQLTAPFAVGPTGAVDIMAVRFEPFGGALISDRMSTLTNFWTDVEAALSELFGEQLAAALAARTGETRLKAIEQLLVRLIGTRPTVHPAVRSAVQEIIRSHGAMQLEPLATRLGVTSRTLQRHFLNQVGVAPKTLARIVRFQNVFRAWNDDPASLSRVAAECEYCDQSHLIRDFRDFAGDAPAAFLATRPEFTSFFLP